MATLVPIPKLGQSEETVTIVNWLVKEGDEIKKGDVLFEVETDKAVLEVESQFEGKLLKVITQAGKEVPVMTIACVLGKDGEAIPEIPKPVVASVKEVKKAVAKKTPVKEVKPEVKKSVEVSSPIVASTSAVSSVPSRKFISPRARAFSKELLINLDKVSGSGPNNRVTEADVKDYLVNSAYFEKKITPSAEKLAKNANLSKDILTGTGVSGRITTLDVKRAIAEQPKKMSKIRQIIAERLLQSKQQIPHFYITVSIDMTELIAFRKELKKSGVSVSINDFIIKASALALKAFPVANSITDGKELSWKSHINVGMAVNIDAGLVVPVIKDADLMTMDELHDVAKELATKARDGKLGPEDMTGGTFTISNMGMLNVENFAAIINPGEGAILAVSSTIPTAVVNIDRQIVIRDIMKVTLSADHRSIDGAIGAFFVNEIKARMQDIDMWKELVDY